MDLTVAHEVEKDRRGKIKYRRFRKGGYDHYKVKLYIKGDDLKNVSHVEYELHPTFSNRNRTVEDPSDNFSLSIWTWGEFDVAVTVYLKDGEIKTFNHPLEYSNQLPANDDAYVDVTPEQYQGV